MFYGWTAKTADIGNSIRLILIPSSFFVLEGMIQKEVTIWSDFLSEAMLWIPEVEMVDSVDE